MPKAVDAGKAQPTTMPKPTKRKAHDEDNAIAEQPESQAVGTCVASSSSQSELVSIDAEAHEHLLKFVDMCKQAAKKAKKLADEASEKYEHLIKRFSLLEATMSRPLA